MRPIFAIQISLRRRRTARAVPIPPAVSRINAERSVHMTTLRKTIGTLFEWEITMIPAEVTRRESRLAGVYLSLFGVVFCGLAIGSVVLSLSTGRFDPIVLAVAIPFAGIGVAVLLIGVNKLRYRLFMRIDSETVFVRLQSLFRNDEWRELLSGYRGVMLRIVESGEQTVRVIELHHPDPMRRVILAEHLVGIVSERDTRARWESYARIINLPALEDAGAGVVERAPGDLDRPYRDIRAVEDAPAVSSARPRYITIEEAGDTQIVVIGFKKMRSWRTLVGALIPAALMSIGFLLPDRLTVEFVAIGLFGALIGVVLIAAIAWDLVASPMIHTDSFGIRVAYRTLCGDTTGKRIPYGEIEEVIVGKEPNNPYPSVLIRSDARTMSVGHAMPMDDLVWLRDYLRGRIR